MVNVLAAEVNRSTGIRSHIALSEPARRKGGKSLSPAGWIMATYTLTTGTDTIVDTSGNDTVYATAATLNAGDRLTGGGGIDTLALYDTGIFPVDALATFTGCARITFNNDTTSESQLRLGNQAISVIGPSLKPSGVAFTRGQSGAWTPIGAEQIAGACSFAADTPKRDGYIRTRSTNRTNTTASDAAHPAGHSSFRGNDQ